MTFIPEGYELFSDWLEREARKDSAYPPEITENDVDGAIDDFEKYVTEQRARGIHFLAVAAPRAVPAPSRVETQARAVGSPLLIEAARASSADADLQLRMLSDPKSPRRRELARQGLERHRVDVIDQLKRQAFEHLRQRMFAGEEEFKTFIIGADGVLRAVPPERWGGDDAHHLVRAGRFEGRSILIRRPVASADADEPDARGVSTVAKEKKCAQWLVEQMKASPERRPRKISDIKQDARTMFGVSGRAFGRAYSQAKQALPKAIVEAWTKHGPLEKIATADRSGK